MRKKSLVIFTLVLTMVICLLFHMTAQAQDRREIQLTREYYDDLEENYVQFTGEFEKLDIKKRTIKICNSLIIIDNISFIVKK